MKKFNGHRCERRNLTDLVLGTGPDGKRRAQPKARKRPKNYTQEPAANKKYLGGGTGDDPLPESGIPTRLRNDPRVMAENMLGLAAGNMMTRFTNPNTGEYYKEYDPRIASYIDDELLGGRFSAKQTDYNYRFLPEGMEDKPENYQYFEEGDPMMPAGAEKNYLGKAWSAGTVSNLATAYDPSFEGSMRHSDYINRAFQGEGNYSPTRATRRTDYQVGDILFQGRGDTKGKGYRAFRKMAEADESYQSHSDIITSIDVDEDGNKTYHVLGGNMGDTLYDRSFTEKDLAKRYTGRMTNTGLGMQSAAYQMENNPLFFQSFPAQETVGMMQMTNGGAVGSSITQDIIDKIQAEASGAGMTATELLNAIKSGNAGAAKLNLLGTGLGAVGNLITTMGEGDDARPDDAYSFTDGLGSVLSGAGQGAMFGPPGMIVGAALGLGKSIFQHHKEKNEFIQAQEEAKEERTEMNESRASDFSDQVLSTYNQEGMVGGSYYTHGGPVDYETEKNEVILAGPNDPPIAIGQGTYKQKSTNLYEGKGPSHAMGGIPTKGATEPFVDQMGQQQDSPYVFSDAKEMRFDATSILSMIS